MGRSGLSRPHRGSRLGDVEWCLLTCLWRSKGAASASGFSTEATPSTCLSRPEVRVCNVRAGTPNSTGGSPRRQRSKRPTPFNTLGWLLRSQDTIHGGVLSTEQSLRFLSKDRRPVGPAHHVVAAHCGVWVGHPSRPTPQVRDRRIWRCLAATSARHQ